MASPGSLRTTGVPITVNPAAPAHDTNRPLINAVSPSCDGSAPTKSALRWLNVGDTWNQPSGRRDAARTMPGQDIRAPHRTQGSAAVAAAGRSQARLVTLLHDP